MGRIGLWAIAIGALVAATPAFANKANNILDFGTGSEPTTLDPDLSVAGIETPYLLAMYDRLLDLDPVTLAVKPMLATAWKWSDDRLTFTLTLRTGVKFHDGTDFNAAAVKASLNHAMSYKRFTDLDAVSGIDTPDPTTVIIHLKAPYAPLPAVLADRAGMMLSPTALAKYNNDLGRNPVGTGPFEFVEWKTGNSVTVKRFEGYWDKAHAAKLAGINFHIIGNPTSMVSAVQSNQLDYASDIDPVNLPVLKKNAALKVEVSQTIGWGMVDFDTSVAPVDNIYVRQAVGMAIDRQALANAVYGPAVHAEAAQLPVPPTYWTSTDPEAHWYKHDPAGAKKLLAEHGLTNVTFPICAPAAGGRLPSKMVTDILTAQLADAGITLKPMLMANSGGCYALTPNHGVAATLVSWSGNNDPYMTYNRLIGSAGTFNMSHKGYPGADDLLKQVLSTPDQAAQKPIYAKLNRAWVENAPVLPLYYLPYVIAYRKELAGNQPAVLFRPDLRWLYFTK